MASDNLVLNFSDNTLWAPYKGLFNIVYSTVSQKNIDGIQDLELALKKHKPELTCLLKNPPRNPIHREAIKKASTTGIAIIGQPGVQILHQSLIDEALIISDMFDLNEVTSLELLIAGQQQQPRFPGLTRGLAAMLLYYDGRRNLMNALQILVQAREGRTWTLDLNPELSALIMKYTDQLKQEGIIIKIIDLVEKMNIPEELDLLHKNRALGGPKYRKQVTDLMKEIKQTLAEVIFSWASQGPFSQEEVLRLLAFLSKQLGLSSDGSLDEPSLTMAMAFLYVMDVSILQTCDESNVHQKLHIVNEPDISIAIHKQLSSQDKWQTSGLKSIFQFAWGITLRTLSQFPVGSVTASLGDAIDEDEKTVDIAIEDGAFQYFKTLMVKSALFHKEEFFLKRIHNIITDFVVLMPLKVKDLRNRGDETARIIASHAQAGLEPPENLPFHFEHLLYLISYLYAKDSLNLELAAEYWCPTESSFEQSYFQRPSPRQIALYKFVRLAGDMLPPPLFVPYHQMLTSLSNSANCAHSCFSMLKMNGKNGSHCSIVSWDHFFVTLHRYYNSLHEEIPTNADLRYTYPQCMHSKGITPQEVQGLIVVLQLISNVVKHDEIARITLCENPQYMPLVVLLGLITCSIPASLKAALISCLASFAASPDIALNIWQGLEMAQVIPTVKSMSVYHPSGILMELEEVETRMEEYPVTRAMLALLDALLNHPYPPALGSANRQPGIEPYIYFVRDSVLLRCNSRAYKTEAEKWKIMGLCFKILEKVLKSSFFHTGTNSLTNPSNVWISVLTQMLQDSELLRMVLFTLDEGIRILDQYAAVPGQSDLEETTALALRTILVTLSKQKAFLQQIRDSGCDLLVTSLDNLLLNINPRSGQADHLLVIAKYITYNIFLPSHCLHSISILHGLCSSINISKHLVDVFDSDLKESESLLKGFVETLEIEVASEEENQEDKMMVTRIKARQQLLQLILRCLRHPGPNLAHYLLGFNLRKSISSTEIQEPGVMGAKRTCLHAVLAFLDSGGYAGAFPTNLLQCFYTAELAYKLIFVLCTNKDTSGPTLRYLRSTHDFLYRHLQFLPFKKPGGPEVKVLRQQSWLLRTLAVELRVTSAHHQRSHVQRLLSCLLDDSAPVESGLLDASLEPSFGVSNMSSYSFLKPSTGSLRKKLMAILDIIDFQTCSPPVPHWDYFENEEIDRLLKECEIQEIEGPELIDIEALHTRMSEETSGIQNASAMGQRPIMMQEIAKVLQFAVSCNKERELVFAKKLLFDAWRQVTEILFIACPLEILGTEKRDQMVLEISQDLLSKMLSSDVMPELMPPASDVILTLMSTLRHSVMSSLRKSVALAHGNNADSFSGDTGAAVHLLHQSSLLVVLRAVVECLFKTGSGFQRVRANFYSAFLNLLCIVQKPYDAQSNQPAAVANLVLDQESDSRKLRLEYMDTILSYGENIMEIICRDACTGHDITKMLSLAVLDVAMSLDTQQQWLAFLSSKGYLRHILDSLSKDDEELQSLFNRNSDSYRIFYVFDSKMSLLTRISCSVNGALALLRNGAIHKLAECRALDLRPNIPHDHKEKSSWLFPDLLKCYRQMFMSIIRLVLSITMTLGSCHREATLQLLEFVVCNGELFSHVIRDPASLDSLEALEELSIISAVLSRAQFDDPTTLASDTFLSEQRGHLLLLRQNLLLLLQRLMHLESSAKVKDREQDSEILARMKMCRLEIASHIIASCRSLVKSGLDARNSTILFSHHIMIAAAPESYQLMPSSFEKRLPMLIGRTPDLGLLITFLFRSATEFLETLDNQKLVSRRLQSLASLTSDELAEYIPPNMKQDQLSAQQHRDIARSCLQKLLKYKDREISILSYIIESSSFILLRHLEYYFMSFKKENVSFTLPETSMPSMRRLQDSRPLSPINGNSPRFSDVSKKLSSEVDFDSFKTDVQSTLGEPFFRKLKLVDQHLSQGKGHVSFLEAIVNRLKRLVRMQTS